MTRPKRAPLDARWHWDEDACAWVCKRARSRATVYRALSSKLIPWIWAVYAPGGRLVADGTEAKRDDAMLVAGVVLEARTTKST